MKFAYAPWYALFVLLSFNWALAEARCDKPDTNCVPHKVDCRAQWFEVKACDVKSPANDPVNKYEIVLDLVKDIHLDGSDQITAVQITFRDPLDTTLHDCCNKPSKRAHYFQAPFFHYVEKMSDPEFDHNLAMLKAASERQCKLKIWFDPGNIMHSWYKLKTFKPSKTR